MKSLLEIEHIPFLEINNPPSHYNLRIAKEAGIKQFGKKFGKDSTFVRWEVEREERRQLLENYSTFKTVYVPISALKEKINQKEESNLIHITSPGLAELGRDKEKIKKHAGAPQFAFGGYHDTDELFLIEDIFKWAHHQIAWVDIRTAESIIKSERRKRGLKS